MRVITLALGLALSSAGLASECGKVTIADMNWVSASFIANVDKIILKEGYGCDAQLVPGDTIPTSTSMVEKSEPDVAPELWTNNIRDVLDRAVKEGKLRYLSKSFKEDAEEGFWVPKYLVRGLNLEVHHHPI